ncbi:carbohydrate kinase [Polaribacter vadi]|uniref:Carbohydrate kinase n=1 Tax=Polaribacter vadi TaxID=1774273 RepID=A0A1B8TYG4_9FLAO|nr:carbohydrate kinase [Polaribacter vadi]AOW16490.1 carbohydrate kinase [Polaribacter vadi]OBY64604.1 carbohydrate kinase [Polaribacter vadi]
MAQITCFGEVLMDVFPTHKKIGGAPLNVAVRLQSFGNAIAIISSVGADKKGKKIVDFIQKNNLNCEGLQVDEQLKTGNVKVSLNSKGSASYEIKFPRAWDQIQLTEKAKNITKEADAFVFGSLVARNEVSRNTLYELLKIANYKIFDVNLRPPYYTIEILSYLMNQANFIKFNDEEIFEIAKALNFESTSLEENIQFIAATTQTKSICVTKGKHGAILYYHDAFYYNKGYHIKVVDTVGAGDSFLASLITKLLKKESPQKALDFACAVGALVAGSEGANPAIKVEDVNKFLFSS